MKRSMKADLMRKLWLAAAGAAALGAQGAGFALYEGSASGIALGGTVMGKARDASANFYNPATLADFTNTVVTAGLAMEYPSCDTKVNGHYTGKMRTGGFFLPHAYVAQPLPADFTFGLGFAPEFGLGTKYRHGWEMDWNTRRTTVEGAVINPNLTYAVTEDWSVSAGIRLVNIRFDQYSYPLAAKDGTKFGQLRTHLKGDNNFSDWGWQLSTRYKILDNLSAGLMYKSYVDTRVRGHYSTRVESYDFSSIPAYLQGTPYYEMYRQQIIKQVDAGAHAANGGAGADIRLPQSLTGGLNWDVTEKVHTGVAVTWTQWSSVESIDFKLHGGDRSTRLNWKDVMRFSWGTAWDFADDWTLMGSYVFDMDPCSVHDDVGSTMLPPGDRHIISGGLEWHKGDWTIAACYGVVLMGGEAQTFHDETGKAYRFNTDRGLSHQFGMSVSYSF